MADRYTHEQIEALAKVVGGEYVDASTLALNLRAAGIELTFPEPRFYVQEGSWSYDVKDRDSDPGLVATFWCGTSDPFTEEQAKAFADEYAKGVNLAFDKGVA